MPSEQLPVGWEMETDNGQIRMRVAAGRKAENDKVFEFSIRLGDVDGIPLWSQWVRPPYEFFAAGVVATYETEDELYPDRKGREKLREFLALAEEDWKLATDTLRSERNAARCREVVVASEA